MDIKHKAQESSGLFFIEKEHKMIAELAYSLLPGNLVIDHTEVSEQLRGKNIGYELVNHAVKYARKEGLKVTPVCAFAKALFEKKPAEYKDVTG